MRVAFLFLLSFAGLAIAQEPKVSISLTNNPEPIDLVTVLRLVNARNLDVQIERQRLAEARANFDSTAWQFFPWISPGVSYRKHNNLTQDAPGTIIDADKQSYTVGPSIVGQWELGDAIYKRLAARQLVNAARSSVEARENENALQAVEAYFELGKARAAEGVADESLRIWSNYAAQLKSAIEIGVAFRADLLRIEVQTEKSRAITMQAREQERIASSKLARILNLDPVVELVPRDGELVPITLVATNESIAALVAKALNGRPELTQSRALTEAAKKNKDSAVYGPMIPSVNAQAFAGGLGGSRSGTADRFGDSEDYQVSLGWRIGPGGLFDRTKVKGAEARLRIAELDRQKRVDEISEQVVSSFARVQSLAEQLTSVMRGLKAAEETLRLSQERKEFAVANVLEVIQAEQELTRSRLDYLNTIAEFNKAQYTLNHAIGQAPPQNALR